jgi:SAM-dependent methyltransferase/methyltransferase-like protein
MDDTVAKLQSAYESISYPFGFYSQTQPDRLAATAILAGKAPPDPENSRVLEIGCASGGNLLPMAEQFPQSQFLGIDLSPRQIELGRKFIDEIGLANIELRCQDILEFPQGAGKFDYIIAHGVYSWVPLGVREKLLAICRDHLSPGGVAFISLNTYPGWKLREPVRELMLYHNRDGGDAAQLVPRGRQILQMMAEHSPETDCYREMLRLNHRDIQKFRNDYILHDHLGTVNEPCYFWQYAQALKANGLSYVGDSDTYHDPWTKLSPGLRETVVNIAPDPLDQEQYLDFLVGRAFRCTVLCLENADQAAVSPEDILQRVYVAGNFSEEPTKADPQGKPGFKFTSGARHLLISNSRPLAVLRRIRSAWPMPVPFSELVQTYRNQLTPPVDETQLLKDVELMVRTYFGFRLIEVMSRPSSVMSPSAGEFPRVSRYARWASARGFPISSLRHNALNMDDSLRRLIPLLDGSRDRKAIAEENLRSASPVWPHQNREALDAAIESALGKLAEMQLLMKPI